MTIHIKSISATAGFIADCKVQFPKGLTCIIGARGTCKSTLIESIRFAFGADPERVSALIGQGDADGEPCFGLIKSTLGAGSVRCEIEQESPTGESAYLLEREVGADTRVFQDGVREHAEPGILHRIEIFSQGDLQRIAEDAENGLRLSLIDRPNAAKISRLQKARESTGKDLLEKGMALRALRAQISTLRQELQPAPQLREQLAQAEASCPQLSSALEAQRALYEKRCRVVESLLHATEVQQDAIRHLLQVREFCDDISSGIETASHQGQPEAAGAISCARKAHDLLRQIILAHDELASCDLKSAIAELTRVFDEKNETFFRLRQGQQAVNESLKMQQHLRRQIEHMERRQQELEVASKRVAELLSQRDSLRARLADLDSQIYSLRIKEIDAINQEHGQTVHLTLQSDPGAGGYAARLSTMLSGSRIRAQEEVALTLSKTFPPAALIDDVESGSGQRFAEVLDRDLGQMNRVVSHLSDHPELYTLESEPPAMKLAVTMYDRGQPKPVESLSKGQKATALLPLILRPLPYPLLFDQPEDDLDNSFIYTSLVTAIRSLKTTRQLIFVTHNANIPVLGEADRIVVMSMRTPTAANPPKAGSVDECKQEVLDLLEGGAEAFRERESRYHDLLGAQRP